MCSTPFAFVGPPSRPIHLWKFLSDHGDLDLRSFPFDRDGLTSLLKPFDVAPDGILSHGSRMFQVLALGNEPGQGGDGHCVAAMLVGFEKGGVLADAAFTILHDSNYILERTVSAKRFEKALQESHKFFDRQLRLDDD